MLATDPNRFGVVYQQGAPNIASSAKKQRSKYLVFSAVTVSMGILGITLFGLLAGSEFNPLDMLDTQIFLITSAIIFGLGLLGVYEMNVESRQARENERRALEGANLLVNREPLTRRPETAAYAPGGILHGTQNGSGDNPFAEKRESR